MVSKITWGIGWTFTITLKSLKYCTLMGSFCPKYIMFQLVLCIMALKGDAKFKGKLTCGLKNDKMNLVNFHTASWMSENLYFDGLLLSKAYKVLDEKVQKRYVSWHWRVMQSLKKNRPLVPKTTWGIWWILTRAVESLKICPFTDCFCRKYVMFEMKKQLSFVVKNYLKTDIKGIWWILSQVVESNVDPLYLMF